MTPAKKYDIETRRIQLAASRVTCRLIAEIRKIVAERYLRRELSNFDAIVKEAFEWQKGNNPIDTIRYISRNFWNMELADFRICLADSAFGFRAFHLYRRAEKLEERQQDLNDEWNTLISESALECALACDYSDDYNL